MPCNIKTYPTQGMLRMAINPTCPPNPVWFFHDVRGWEPAYAFKSDNILAIVTNPPVFDIHRFRTEHDNPIVPRHLAKRFSDRPTTPWLEPT